MSKMGEYVRERMEDEQVEDIEDLAQNQKPFIKVFQHGDKVSIIFDDERIILTPKQADILRKMLGRL
jgi:hypothetical protein